ncbi:MAG: DsrE family protein [Candidatus Sabulitectum sp.]|nr:DsrE family protein [Candidatus Sabulitectum sp.]
MQKILIIINDAPYGTEKAYNALRLAMNTIKYHKGKVEIWVFLLADGVFCGLPGQVTPDGYYNVERMLKYILKRGGLVKACGICAEARGIHKLKFQDGIELSDMEEFAKWTVESDKVITF